MPSAWHVARWWPSHLRVYEGRRTLTPWLANHTNNSNSKMDEWNRSFRKFSEARGITILLAFLCVPYLPRGPAGRKGSRGLRCRRMTSAV